MGEKKEEGGRVEGSGRGKREVQKRGRVKKLTSLPPSTSAAESLTIGAGPRSRDSLSASSVVIWPDMAAERELGQYWRVQPSTYW